jgi:hypothetical protein
MFAQDTLKTLSKRERDPCVNQMVVYDNIPSALLVVTTSIPLLIRIPRRHGSGAPVREPPARCR